MLPTMLPIILAIRDEDDRNFVEEAYTKYEKQLQATAKYHLENRLDIEDCVQDVVVVLIDRVEDFRNWDEIHQLCFLTKSCRFIAINKYNYNERRAQKEISYNHMIDGKDFDFVDEDAYIESIVISKENLKRFAQMIDEMDSKYGDILYFKCFLRMKNVEIAKMINVSEQLVSARLKQARTILLTTRRDEFYAIFRK
jgi:RNA polymerase sigma factor (sigma-70 family)